MGLDQYAVAFRLTEEPEKQVDFVLPAEREEVAYWRKHANLQGWMAKLYWEKGGADPDFNVVPLMLSEADLLRLREETEARTLPYTTGFFFGESTREDDKPTVEFIDRAIDLIREGYTVAYYAWY